MLRQELLHTLRKLWKNPNVGREDIVAFQNRKIRRLIRHAYSNVSYYQKLFDRAGIDPEDIRTVQDLSRIPVTEKNDLRTSSPEEVLTRNSIPDRLVSRLTSGHSGSPFVVRRGQLEEHIINMFRIRAKRQHGLRFRDRTASVAVVYLSEKRDTWLTGLRHKAGIYRRYDVDCVQSPETICRLLEELDPDIIEGYPSAVSHIAPLVEGRFRGKRLRYVGSGGETLTGVKRRAIERGFGVPVYDIFGAHECNLVSWECPQTGLHHVCDDNAVVEVLRDGREVGQGESGELVITALHSYTMPFIRYRMGNIVVKGPETCPCGQPFSTWHEIVGRVREYFILPNGVRIHPLRVLNPIFTEKAPWIKQFQLTQETKTRFVLRVAVFWKPPTVELESLRKKLFNGLGPGAELRVEFVDHIPFEPSGKFKDCRNLISPDEE